MAPNPSRAARARRPGRHPSDNAVTGNRPTVAAAAATAAGALAGWGLDAVEWPGPVEAALLALAVAVGGALGKIAQRGTWPDSKVQDLIAEVSGHG